MYSPWSIETGRAATHHNEFPPQISANMYQQPNYSANSPSVPQELVEDQSHTESEPWGSPIESGHRAGNASPTRRGTSPARHGIPPPADLPLDETGPSRRATPAEKAREMKLRADPVIIIHGPQLVECRRCGTTIKLSLKSQWDPAHWQKHRERCIQRDHILVGEIRKSNERRKVVYPAKVKIVRASKRKAPSPTPSLTPDTDGDRSSEAVSIGSSMAMEYEEAEPPQAEERELLPGPAHPIATLREPDPVVEEYLARSRRRPTRDFRTQLPTSWQDWRWSQLKAPIWIAETRPGEAPPVERELSREREGDLVSMFALSAIRDEPYERAQGPVGHQRLGY